MADDVKTGGARPWLIVLLAAAPLLFFGALWAAFGGVGYSLALRRAREAYRGSRPQPCPQDSFEFATGGISHDMTEEEVETVLRPAESTCRMAMAERREGRMAKWDGFVRLYICHYGEPWRNPVFGREEVLAQEWFWVYFDTSGRAKQILRHVTVGSEGETMVVDLERRTVCPP